MEFLKPDTAESWWLDIILYVHSLTHSRSW
jgi:hypothetical protein